MSTGTAIHTEHLTKRYRQRLAVDDLSLEVQRGEIFGFVGENGAGKTTTIRLLLGLAKPTDGRVDVLGFDPRDSRRAHLLMAKLGYVSETRAMYDWMRVSAIIDFCAGVHGETWDHDQARALVERFGFDLSLKVKELSRGKRALLMLLLAVAHWPELLVLDEPSSGLDPVARREILEQVIETIQAEGRTVFFSSHLLDEVERVADRVGFLHEGKLVMVESLDALHARWRRVRLVWPGEPKGISLIKGVSRVVGDGREQAVITDSFSDDLCRALGEFGAEQITPEPLSLEDIFVEVVRRN
ncbi:ABC transporter ATP-binding protein [Candidatus Sumerlaeota bacterium]|nr:ABC transporter ATP-binding protein [Candidatus Sumerlaeota bacterium]